MAASNYVKFLKSLTFSKIPCGLYNILALKVTLVSKLNIQVVRSALFSQTLGINRSNLSSGLNL